MIADAGQRTWLNISAAEYHELDALGSGAVKCFAMDGNLEFYARYVAKTKERDDTDAMRLGRAFHAAMEDESGWEKLYRVVPTKIEDDEYVEAINAELKESGSKAAPLIVGVPLYLKFPAHRKYLECHKLAAQREGQDFLTESEVDLVHRQVDVVYDSAECADLLQHKGKLNVEVSCVYKHHSGLMTKALNDLIVGGVIVDFKTTDRSGTYNIAADFLRRGYDWQSGLYRMVTGKDEFLFVSVTKSEPFEALVFEVPAARTIECHDKIHDQLFQIADMMRAGVLDDTDSQGVPHRWHNELWGARIPLDLDELRRRRDRDN